MQPEKLKTWLKRQPERVTLFRVLYSGIDGGNEILGEWNAEDHKSQEAKGELAAQMVDSAQNHCDELNVIARYCSVSFEGEIDSPKEMLRQVMQQTPTGIGDDNDSPGYTPEDATAAGLAGQAIRHTEAMTRMLVTSIQQIMGIQAQQVDQLQRSVAMYQKREGEILDLARALATSTEDAVAKERNADRWDRLQEVVTEKLGPKVLEHIGLLPEDIASVKEAVKGNGATADTAA